MHRTRNLRVSEERYGKGYSLREWTGMTRIGTRASKTLKRIDLRELILVFIGFDKGIVLRSPS